jgi:hypothetical protein
LQLVEVTTPRRFALEDANRHAVVVPVLFVHDVVHGPAVDDEGGLALELAGIGHEAFTSADAAEFGDPRVAG